MVNFEKKMTEELTFTMIKPDAVEKKHMASILSLIADAGFEIIAIKMKKLKLKEAESLTRKALQLDPNYAIAHSNLGGILNCLLYTSPSPRDNR